jgi:hypothetical protein
MRQDPFLTEAARTLSAGELTAQLQEALVMAGMASLRNDLSVTLGEWWTFNWKTNVISLPKTELERCPGEEICWIILHESAHAALTRLHDIVPSSVLGRPEVQLLLNCAEDVRIENWLLQRFPGSRPWKEVADRMGRLHEPASLEEAEGEHPTRAFLRGIIQLGITGNSPSLVHPVAKQALEEARPALEAAFTCVPPSASVDREAATAVYSHHPVSRCYSEADHRQEPDAMEKWVRIMQAAFWTHVSTGVLPVFMRLVEEFGCPQSPLRSNCAGGIPGAGDQPPAGYPSTAR